MSPVLVRMRLQSNLLNPRKPCSQRKILRIILIK
jgi:hypothetical protein